MPPGWLTAGIVLCSFALLFVRRLGGVPLDRSVTAATGAVLAVAIGAIAPTTAVRAVDASTLLLLFGMLVHVEGVARSGFYEHAAARLVGLAGTPRRLALGTLVLAAGLSAVALNDATVLLVTPILVRATRGTDVDPVPALVALVVGANVGSVATPLGNPQNAFVLAHSPLSLAGFVAGLLPVALLSLGVAAVAVFLVTPTSGRVEEPALPAYDRGGAALAGVLVAATFLLLFLRPSLDPGVVAASTAVVHVAARQVLRDDPGSRLLREVDWSLLVLFAGMFVLVAALRTTAVVPMLESLAGTPVGLGVAAFVLSNLVSNVPATVVLSAGVSTHQGWLLLAAVATLAGNATPVASAAGLITMELAAREGVTLPVRSLVRVGLPVALVTSALAVGVLVRL